MSILNLGHMEIVAMNTTSVKRTKNKPRSFSDLFHCKSRAITGNEPVRDFRGESCVNGALHLAIVFQSERFKQRE
jgi:hypothetical protein